MSKSPLSHTERRELSQGLRESARSRRREYQRALAGVRQSPDSRKSADHLLVVTDTWLLDVEARLERCAHSPAIKSLWEEVELCDDIHGLVEAVDWLREAVLDKSHHPTPGDVTTIASALECATILAYDLHPRPPVVDDPWTPDELPSLEELTADVDASPQEVRQ